MTTETTIEGIITPLEAHKAQEFNSLGMPIDIFYVREKSTEMTVAETRNEGLANLIARAPALAEQNAELREALRELMEFVPHNGGTPEMRKAALKARAAIAKAEGGE